MLICPNVKSREFWSGYISLYQASRISRPLDVALTICQCGQCCSFSILFFSKSRPSWSAHRRAPTHRGVSISRGAHLSKKRKKKNKGVPRKNSSGRLLNESFCIPFILTSMGGSVMKDMISFVCAKFATKVPLFIF